MFKSILKKQLIPISVSLMCGLGFMLYANKPNSIHVQPQATHINKFANPGAPIEVVPCEDACVKLSLLLDTSSSMNGLIEQAKSQLWRIVKELSQASKDGNAMGLQIALYEYGNDRLDKRKGYIKQLSPLTSDIDLISEKLFSLTTNGGSEYCGQVIQSSLNELEWGDDNGELKIIYIAGNEPFTQGPMKYQNACANAKDKDVIVNTIFCGDYKEGINTKWKNGAILTGGEYMNIDHNQQTVYYDSPYDDQLDALNTKLNDSYISYGSKGESKLQILKDQDSNAASYSKANKSDRISFKSSKAYKNSSWELIDAYEENEDKVINNKEDLPQELRGKSKEEIKAFIKKKQVEREEIKKEIGKLAKERDAYVAKKRKENNNDLSLDENILKSVKKQAKGKGYSF